MAKVSVCIPTYNRSDYLQYSVNSVLKQTYTDFELIICDDGSTDDTPDVVQNFVDSRIRYIRHSQNIGRSNNMRSGFETATGEYFIKFDDDDAFLFRYSTLKEVDYMRPEADGCEDFDLLVRLAIAGKTGYFLPELLMEYRFHGSQNSLKQSLHFLKAQKFCCESYSFQEEKLKKKKEAKLAELNLDIGLRLIEKGDEVAYGRNLIRQSQQFEGLSFRSMTGLLISYVPFNLRSILLSIFRKLKPKDYADQIRESHQLITRY